MDLNQIRIFIKVVQAGSFHQAAQQLSIPNSTVSAKVSALERRLGVTLLTRTTRKLALTQVGEIYFQHCARALEEIMGAESQINSSLLEPQGTLRVTAPVDLGNTCMRGILSLCQKKYPKLKIDFIFSDQRLDLIAQGIDIAIRAGSLSDSGLISKKLGLSHWAPYASPSYLKTYGTPAHPKDLNLHKVIDFTPFKLRKWELSRNSSVIKVSVKSVLGGNDINLTKALCIDGHGITLLPSFACRNEIKNKGLVRILPDWTAFNDPIHLLYAGQKFLPPKIRAFIDIAVPEFKKILSE